MCIKKFQIHGIWWLSGLESSWKYLYMSSFSLMNIFVTIFDLERKRPATSRLKLSNYSVFL